MAVGMRMTKDNAAKVVAAIESLTLRRVMVGVPGSETQRPDKDGEAEAPNNATLAYVHDNGSAAANIPARPFMRPGIASVKQDITDILARGMQAAIKGNKDGADNSLDRAGTIARAGIQKYIANSGNFKPLSPVTLAKRRLKGRKGDKPLIDTGQLRRSINYVIRAIAAGRWKR